MNGPAGDGGARAAEDALRPTLGQTPRTDAASQREMMRLVAELYYVRELGQPEIAALTGFSVSKVSRLLAAARAAGVVRISVEGAPSEPTPLARALSAALGVEVWVTPGHETAPGAGGPAVRRGGRASPGRRAARARGRSG